MSKILAPVEYQNFYNDYWEAHPLHIERSDSSYFKQLLSEESLLALIESGAASFPDVQAINARSPIPVCDYTKDKMAICAERMMQCYADGATIVVSEVHRKFPALQEACLEFSKTHQMRCQANAYLSPAGNQGFHSHYDTHDVFVLQVAGRKKFQFYSAGIKLPFIDDTYTPEHKAHSEMMDEVEVSSGDTLYIPRGIVHDAIADDGEPSLHITLGAFPFVLRDLLQEMMQVASENDVAYRSSVDLQQRSVDMAGLKNKAAGFFTEKIYAEAVSRLADEVSLSLPVEANAALEFSLQSTIALLHGNVFSTEKINDTLKLRVPGLVLSFEDPMAIAVDAILSAGAIKVSDIPALNNEQKLALCRQLAEAGAITVGNAA